MNKIAHADVHAGPAGPAADPVPALDVENLTVHYGKRPVLVGLGLKIGPGEIFGLLGPNGAGKTTLVRTICGRIKPRSGRIRIAGAPNTQRASRRRIGLVPQEIALYPHLTARENLITFGRLSGLTRHQCLETLDFAIASTDLAKQVDRQVHKLSGGWKRRTNIAAALMHQPSLLILDEPTVGVDVDARNALHGVIRDLGRSGLAVLLATHDLDQAQSLCDRVGFLRGGLVDPCGRPDELLQLRFAGERVLFVDLFAPAVQSTRDMLQRLGFSEQPSGLEWSRMINATSQNQVELIRALRRTDLLIKEIRFREPGLDTLFLQLTGKAMPA